MANLLAIGIGVVAVLVFGWAVLTYNRIVRLENRIDNAWGQIDVQLRRRAELIPNLVDTVQGYADFEQEVLENVTKARARLQDASGRQESMQAEGLLEQALGKLFAVAEDYPDLKANESFLQLQDELTHTENKISFARQSYNDAVLRYNNAVETMPAAIVARLMGRSERDMLEIPEEAREVPDVNFE
jgi:LemA protein